MCIRDRNRYRAAGDLAVEDLCIDILGMADEYFSSAFPAFGADGRTRRRQAIDSAAFAADHEIFRHLPAPPLCVPKTLSALINRRNRLTSEDNVRPALFNPGRLGVAIQVEEPA